VFDTRGVDDAYTFKLPNQLDELQALGPVVGRLPNLELQSGPADAGVTISGSRRRASR
jgi:hypothetical protein